MRIVESAHRHGVADDDIRHAVRHARAFVERDENVAIAIGPARDGTPLEVGVVDIDGDDPVAIHAMKLRTGFYRYLGEVTMNRRTDAELEELATGLEDWAGRVDPDAVKVDYTDDLRAVADAADAARAAQARLVEAVAVARARGRSWNRIAIPLGVSRQAARERFGRLVAPEEGP